ncbi:MAG TPA: hypothetical protein VLM89_09855 [Phycisphaerae bacterium]|nr:hypothetical protein [Phycisphaerae bacterium]
MKNEPATLRGGSPVTLLWCLVAGVLLALPIGWLLATLILLPFMLGLFFYMLFGLLAGAVVYRAGRSAIPISKPRAWALGLTVSFLIWFVGLIGEYYNVRGYDLYLYGSQGFGWHPVDGDATRKVRLWFEKRSFNPEQVAELRSRTRWAFNEQLRNQYPPGGFAGFLKWSAQPTKIIQVPRVFAESGQELEPPQSGIKWFIRLAVSFVLLAGAVCSQILGLAQPPPRPDESPGPPQFPTGPLPGM